MTSAHAANDFLTELRRKIAEAERRMDRAESDGEWEACRQVVIGLRAKLPHVEGK